MAETDEVAVLLSIPNTECWLIAAQNKPAQKKRLPVNHLVLLRTQQPSNPVSAPPESPQKKSAGLFSRKKKRELGESSDRELILLRLQGHITDATSTALATSVTYPLVKNVSVLCVNERQYIFPLPEKKFYAIVLPTAVDKDTVRAFEATLSEHTHFKHSASRKLAKVSQKITNTSKTLAGLLGKGGALLEKGIKKGANLIMSSTDSAEEGEQRLAPTAELTSLHRDVILPVRMVTGKIKAGLEAPGKSISEDLLRNTHQLLQDIERAVDGFAAIPAVKERIERAETSATASATQSSETDTEFRIKGNLLQAAKKFASAIHDSYENVATALSEVSEVLDDTASEATTQVAVHLYGDEAGHETVAVARELAKDTAFATWNCMTIGPPTCMDIVMDTLQETAEAVLSERCEDDLQDVRFEGDLLHKSQYIEGKWKKRWAVLTGEALRLYKERDGVGQTAPATTVRLAQLASVGPPEPVDSDCWAVRLELRSGDAHYIATPDRAVCTQWATMLESARKAAAEGPSAGQ